jgi:hypothetical protein
MLAFVLSGFMIRPSVVFDARLLTGMDERFGLTRLSLVQGSLRESSQVGIIPLGENLDAEAFPDA